MILMNRCARQVPFVVVVLGGIGYDFDGQVRKTGAVCCCGFGWH